MSNKAKYFCGLKAMTSGECVPVARVLRTDRGGSRDFAPKIRVRVSTEVLSVAITEINGISSRKGQENAFNIWFKFTKLHE